MEQNAASNFTMTDLHDLDILKILSMDPTVMKGAYWTFLNPWYEAQKGCEVILFLVKFVNLVDEQIEFAGGAGAKCWKKKYKHQPRQLWKHWKYKFWHISSQLQQVWGHLIGPRKQLLLPYLWDGIFVKPGNRTRPAGKQFGFSITWSGVVQFITITECWSTHEGGCLSHLHCPSSGLLLFLHNNFFFLVEQYLQICVGLGGSYERFWFTENLHHLEGGYPEGYVLFWVIGL